MSTELKAKLEAKRITRKAIFDDIESLRANEAKADKEIADLEKQIAEEAKPKLRHGDCVQLSGGFFYLINDKHNCNPPSERPFGIGATGGGQVNIDNDRHEPVVLFNAYDDAKALQETVTEFEIIGVGDGTIKAAFGYASTDSFRIKVSNGYGTELIIRMKFEDVLKLRQMEATLKRK